CPRLDVEFARTRARRALGVCEERFAWWAPVHLSWRHAPTGLGRTGLAGHSAPEYPAAPSSTRESHLPAAIFMEAAARTFPLTGKEALMGTASLPVTARRSDDPSPPNRRFERGEFAEMVTKHQQALYGYMRARVIEPSDADDLCQEVFL